MLFCICSGQILQTCTYQNRHFVEFCVITLLVMVSSRQKILSILMKVTVQVPCLFHSKNLNNIIWSTGTQTQPLLSFYYKCF